MNRPTSLFLSYFLVFFACFFYHETKAQKETDIWYFGKYAGLDFSSGTPVSLSNSALSTEEGCVTISNAGGKLLFYTDGIKVWDKNHKMMPNGDELKGDPSSTQSGVVIPKPNSKNLFYLFTVDGSAGEGGFCYSLIDLKLNNGLGDVSDKEKNILLKAKVTEKLTAVRHRNNKDIWVIVHEWESDAFLAYLVTEQGINKIPIVSNVGSIHTGKVLETQGYMKLNPDGTNLALALEASHAVELFDFDNATGKISNPIKIQQSDKSYTYGIEFSPSGSVLYVSAAGEGKIYQYNLQAGSVEAIRASATLVGQSPKKEWIGALQLAANGKIYFTIYGTSYLGVIDKPEQLGLACGYQNNAVSLGKGIAQLGLPTFNQTFFNNVSTTSTTINYFENNIEKGKTFILKNIQFDFAKYSLQASSFATLDKVVKALKDNPTWKITIIGHTDNIGNKSNNIVLSENRAASVKQYLVSKGISKERISSKGLGSSQPIANNNNDAGRAQNRRVEFRMD